MVRKNIIYEHKHLEMIVSETIHIKKKKNWKTANIVITLQWDFMQSFCVFVHIIYHVEICFLLFWLLYRHKPAQN